MLLLQISSQSFTKHARSSLATTELASTSTRFGHSNNGDTKQKTIYYMPQNRRFFIWYNSYLVVFWHEYQSREITSQEEVSVSCFSKSPQILRELLSKCCIKYSKLVQDKTSLYKHKDSTQERSIVLDIRPILTVILDKSRKRELLKDIKDFFD